MPDFPDPGGEREWPIYTATVAVALVLPIYWMLGPGSRLEPEEIERAVALQDTIEHFLWPVPATGAWMVDGTVGAGGTDDVEGPDGTSRVDGGSGSGNADGTAGSDPFRFGSAPPARGSAPVRSSDRPADAGAGQWRVSAILTMRGEHVAIVNDVPVSEGDVLPGGVEVTSVTADRVVLTRPGGARIVLPF